MWLCVAVLTGLFCNVSHTVAETNTTYGPDFVSMPCSVNRENGERHSAFHENGKKPKYIGCEILLVTWHWYPPRTAGADEERCPCSAEQGPDSSWGKSARCPCREAAWHKLPTHHPQPRLWPQDQPGLREGHRTTGLRRPIPWEPAPHWTVGPFKTVQSKPCPGLLLP